ncbi:hypothetical protein CRUP_002488 [Coryphaenoides rupestris]|nr:hypothetical protein CRUP_002488 [Coryphaenoides rupestris]
MPAKEKALSRRFQSRRSLQRPESLAGRCGSAQLEDVNLTRSRLADRIRGSRASKQFAEEVLRSHNDYRRTHQAPPLKLCSKLSREAARWGHEVTALFWRSFKLRFQRRKLESSVCVNVIGKDVADRWYDEVKQYNFNRPGFSSGTGHFTAMVWKSTTKLGVGKATASDGSSFVVARYFPAGNITNQGHFDSNVLPAKGQTASP